MDLFLAFVLVPVLGVFWYLNLIKFIEKLHDKKDTHNQKILGGVWTFVFIAGLIYSIAIITNYN